MKRKVKCATAALVVLLVVIAAWYAWPQTLEDLTGVSLEKCRQVEVRYWRDMSPYTSIETFIMTPEDPSFPVLLSAVGEQKFSRLAYSFSANDLLPEQAFCWTLVFALEDGSYVRVDENFNQPSIYRGSRRWRVRAEDQRQWRTYVRDILLGSQGVQPR